jgi:hypothetical protein
MSTKRETLENVLEDAGDGKVGARLFLTAVLAVLDKLDEVQAAIESGKDPKPPK